MRPPSKQNTVVWAVVVCVMAALGAYLLFSAIHAPPDKHWSLTMLAVFLLGRALGRRLRR